MPLMGLFGAYSYGKSGASGGSMEWGLPAPKPPEVYRPLNSDYR